MALVYSLGPLKMNMISFSPEPGTETFLFRDDVNSNFGAGILPNLNANWYVSDGLVSWTGDPDFNFATGMVFVGGENLGFNGINALTSGTVTGLFLASGTTEIESLVYVVNTNIPAISYQSARNTVSFADDLMLLQNMLAGNDEITGSEFDDFIYAGTGNDSVNSDMGNDTIYGGAGKDTLYAFLGNDYLSGGNSGDFLNGLYGNDTLFGGNGSDEFLGGHGRDFMNAGNDTVRDVFTFTSILDSGLAANRDIIVEFDRRHDVINFRQIDAVTSTGRNDAFAFSNVGPAAHSIWLVVVPAGTSVFADVNGDLTADMEIRINDAFNLSALNFVL